MITAIWGLFIEGEVSWIRPKICIKKALEIDKKIGRLEGQAIRYQNLGLVYEQRGDVEKAREYWEKALELYKKIGMPHMVEKVEGWIERISDK